MDPLRPRRRRLDWLLMAIVAVVVLGSGYGGPRASAAVAELQLTSEGRPTLDYASAASIRLPPLSIPQQVADGHHWRLDTPSGAVHVWLPHGYVAETAVAVVYVHGYFTDLDGAWFGHRLPSQFALAGINAMFIACEAPSGKLEPVRWPSLRALLATVEAKITEPMPAGRVVAVGHSGAFRTLELWLPNPRLDTIVLLDAAYGDMWGYRRWLLEAADRRLINISEDTVTNADLLHRALPSTVVLDGFSLFGIPEEARNARIVYIRSAIGHMPLVTGGIALPSVLRALRVNRVLTAPIPYPL